MINADVQWTSALVEGKKNSENWYSFTNFPWDKCNRKGGRVVEVKFALIITERSNCSDFTVFLLGSTAHYRLILCLNCLNLIRALSPNKKLKKK